MRRRIPVLLLAACCGTPIPIIETGTSGAGSSSTTFSSASTSNASSDGSTSSTTTGIDASSQSGHCGFLGCEDVGDSDVDCSLWTQDCPPGEKCAPWANDGGSAWNGTRCVPTAATPDQPGEPCTTDGAVASGLDSCDVGSICWNIDAATGTGLCIPHCTGTDNAPTCADPMRRCHVWGNGVLAQCLARCAPLESDTCANDEACYPIDSGFICAPDDSGADGAIWDACQSTNDCDPGVICVNPELSAMCPPGSGGCCLPVCNTSASDCPAAMLCEGWFQSGQIEPGYEDVGVCRDARPKD